MKTKPDRKYSEKHCDEIEDSLNAGYLCVTLEEAFLPVVLHVEGTNARCHNSHGGNIFLDILVFQQAQQWLSSAEGGVTLPHSFTPPSAHTCAGTVGYLCQRGLWLLRHLHFCRGWACWHCWLMSHNPLIAWETTARTGSTSLEPCLRATFNKIVRKKSYHGEAEWWLAKTWRIDGCPLIHHF